MSDAANMLDKRGREPGTGLTPEPRQEGGII